MDSLDLDQVTNEIVPRGESNRSGLAVVDFPRRHSLVSADDAHAALALVSEAAAAVRQLEEQSAQAVARAHNAANAVMEKLERSEARAERAEMALRQAEKEIAELTTAAMQAHKDIEMLQSCLSEREADFNAMEERALAAERRAEDANAAIQRIVTAIRTQLPVATAPSDERSGDAA